MRSAVPRKGSGSGERGPSGLPGAPDSLTRFPLLRKARVLVPHPWGALWARQQGPDGRGQAGCVPAGNDLATGTPGSAPGLLGGVGVCAPCGDQGRA